MHTRSPSRAARRVLVSASVLGVATPALAQVPAYDFARLPINGAVGFVSQTPSLNNSRQAALGLFDASDNALLFLGDTSGGRIIPMPNTNDDFDFDTISINNATTPLAFITLDGGPQQGLYTVPIDSGTPTRIAASPSGVISLDLFGDDTGGAGGLLSSGGSLRRYVSYDAAGNPTSLAATSGLDINSDLAYLFSPAVNNAGTVAGFVRIGNDPFDDSADDEIRAYASDGSGFTVLAVDRDVDPTSPVVEFSSVAPGFNDQDQAVFLAFDAASGGNTQLFKSEGGIVTELFNDGPTGDFDDILIFSPALGDSGLFAFLATAPGDSNRGVYVGDLDGNFTRLAGPGDTLTTADGTFVVSSIPLAPNVNDNGDVIFYANVVGGGAEAFVATVVPEPTTLSLLALGGLTLLRRRR